MQTRHTGDVGLWSTFVRAPGWFIDDVRRTTRVRHVALRDPVVGSVAIRAVAASDDGALVVDTVALGKRRREIRDVLAAGKPVYVTRYGRVEIEIRAGGGGA